MKFFIIWFGNNFLTSRRNLLTCVEKRFEITYFRYNEINYIISSCVLYIMWITYYQILHIHVFEPVFCLIGWSDRPVKRRMWWMFLSIHFRCENKQLGSKVSEMVTASALCSTSSFIPIIPVSFGHGRGDHRGDQRWGNSEQGVWALKSNVRFYLRKTWSSCVQRTGFHPDGLSLIVFEPL